MFIGILVTILIIVGIVAIVRSSRKTKDEYADAMLDKIRKKVSFLDVVREKTALHRRNWALPVLIGKRDKIRWWGCCPFHQEKTPSFYVKPGKGVFYCFRCHKGGDLFQFVMEADKCSFKAAVEKLAKRAGIKTKQKGDKG